MFSVIMFHFPTSQTFNDANNVIGSPHFPHNHTKCDEKQCDCDVTVTLYTWLGSPTLSPGGVGLPVIFI